MKLFVIPNPTKVGTSACFQELKQVCRRLSMTILLESRFADLYGDETVIYGEFESLAAQCDFVVVIGGDGTILHTAKALIRSVPRPVIGINTGRLGFLSSLESGEMDAFEKLFTGEYALQDRMLLSVTFSREGKEETQYALNDAVICRGNGSGIVDLKISCRGRHVATYTADGLIFSTPSGSTAYALSAGGPVIDPDLSCIEVTPICAHSMFSRPMLFSGKQELEVQTVQTPTRWASLTVDGEEAFPIDGESSVKIAVAPTSIQLVDLTGKTFYEVLNKKIISKTL